jgi:cytochrome oxidase Cu insertion factor (SCO1/SenC/PrrC family)
MATPAGLRAAVPAAQDVYAMPLRWQDDHGHAFELASLAGTSAVMTLAYGACRRICSTALRTMEQLQGLADARRVTLDFVVVGLDPAADKPADWAAFRQDRQLNRANWHFLTGDDATVRRLATRLGVNYWRTGEHLMHDFRIVLLGPDGRLLRGIDTFDAPVQSLLPG